METNTLIETESATTTADTAEQAPVPEQMIIGMRRHIFCFYVRVLIIGAPISLAVGSLAALAAFYLTK
jgi:hypothetical protein